LTLLITDAQLQRRVRALARQIEHDFAGRDLVVVSLLNGTVMFLADLVRHLPLPMRLDFIGVSSYREGDESQRIDFSPKNSGWTCADAMCCSWTTSWTRAKRCVAFWQDCATCDPRRIKICVLLEKKGRRTEKVRADYVGFRIPDLFVVGYGLDFAERYRNLPFVGVLKPELYQSP